MIVVESGGGKVGIGGSGKRGKVGERGLKKKVCGRGTRLNFSEKIL